MNYLYLVVEKWFVVAPTIPTLPCKIQEGGIPERDQLIVFCLENGFQRLDFLSSLFPHSPLGACLRGVFERKQCTQLSPNHSL